MIFFLRPDFMEWKNGWAYRLPISSADKRICLQHRSRLVEDKYQVLYRWTRLDFED